MLETNTNLSLLEVELETGRPHQIRVQLNGIGHPLYGDQKYGQHVNKVGEQIALWAYELTLIHPTTKEVITVHSFPKQIYPWSEWAYIRK